MFGRTVCELQFVRCQYTSKCELLQRHPRDAQRHSRSEVAHKFGLTLCYDKLTTVVGQTAAVRTLRLKTAGDHNRPQKT